VGFYLYCIIQKQRLLNRFVYLFCVEGNLFISVKKKKKKGKFFA